MKKSLKIILIVLGIILVFGITTGILDYKRIRDNKEPIFTLEFVNGATGKVTYVGMGYKIIRYAGVSIKEPFENNVGVKFGSWFMNYKISEDKSNKEFTIVDKTQNLDDFVCASVLEKIYEDEFYTYSLSCIKSNYIVVKYDDGTEENIKEALNNKKVKISDLDKFGIKYYKEENVDVHSFYGKVIESHEDYIVVEQTKDTKESKIGGKFRIELGNNNDAIYEIGIVLKITYIGGIDTSDPMKIDVKNIEIKSVDEFELVFNQEPGNTKRLIVDKNKNKVYDYNIYLVGGTVDIIIDKVTYSLEDALNDNKITMEEIISKANNDIKEPLIYNDGGSVEYHYSDYTIVKMHTVTGNRDVFIGDKSININNVK